MGNPISISKTYIHGIQGQRLDGEYTAVPHWTFSNPDIRNIISENIGGKVLNACSGKTELPSCEGESIIRNDLNTDRDADYHLDVCSIDEHFSPNEFDVIIFDPPFDESEADEYYEGIYPDDLNTARKALGDILRKNGKFIELGWNTQGVAAWEDWKREEIHIFERGPKLRPVFLCIDIKIK